MFIIQQLKYLTRFYFYKTRILNLYRKYLKLFSVYLKLGISVFTVKSTSGRILLKYYTKKYYLNLTFAFVWFIVVCEF